MNVTFSSAEHSKGCTATGPPGWTFSHFIPATFDPLLAAFDATMVNIPYAMGPSLLQWQYGTNVLIPKSVASLRVDKLQTILLLHLEFNQNNKLLGRAVMSQAEAYAQMPPEQYGSRKKHQAIKAALNKVLTQDIWRRKRQSGALCSNDTKACYDRVVHPFAILCMLRLGTPMGPLLYMFIKLQKMKHFICTALESHLLHLRARRYPFKDLDKATAQVPLLGRWSAPQS
jgi:hypothetical protein